MPRAKKRWKSEQAKQNFMKSPKGVAWLEKKMAERRAARAPAGPPPERLTRTKYPFRATINGRPVIVTKEEIVKIDHPPGSGKALILFWYCPDCDDKDDWRIVTEGSPLLDEHGEARCPDCDGLLVPSPVND